MTRLGEERVVTPSSGIFGVACRDLMLDMPPVYIAYLVADKTGCSHGIKGQFANPGPGQVLKQLLASPGLSFSVFRLVSAGASGLSMGSASTSSCCNRCVSTEQEYRSWTSYRKLSPSSSSACIQHPAQTELRAREKKKNRGQKPSRQTQ